MDLKAEIAKLKQSRLARNAGWMFLGQGLGLIFQTTYFIVLARLLGSREYGIYAGTFALVSMASQYSTIGSGTVFLRYVSPDKSKFPVYWGNILLITCTVSFLVSAVLYFTARFILNPLSAALIFPAAVSVCFCTQIAVAAGQVFQAFEQLRVTAMMNLLTNIMACHRRRRDAGPAAPCDCVELGCRLALRLSCWRIDCGDHRDRAAWPAKVRLQPDANVMPLKACSTPSRSQPHPLTTMSIRRCLAITG